MSWKKNKFFFFFLILLFFFLPARAEELSLDLKEAVNLALERNLALEQAEKDFDIAHWNQRMALSAYLPQAAADFSLAKEYGHSRRPSEEGYRLDLKLRQSLINLSQIADIRAAALGKGYYRMNRDSYRQFVVFEAARRFYGSLLGQKKLEIRKEASSLAKEEMGIAQERYEKGLVSYYDFLRSETRFLSAKANLSQAEAEYQKSLNQFKNILGWKPDKNISLRGDFKQEIADVDLAGLLDKVYSLHPGLAAVNYLVKQKEQVLASCRADFLPRLDFEAVQSAANYRATGFGFAGGSTDSFSWNDYWTAYLRVSLPLFEGTGRYSRLKRAEADLKKTRAKEKELANEIRKDIDSFYRDFVSARELTVSQKNNLEKSQELYRVVRQRYKAGQASEIELLDAHLNLIDVESAYKEAKYQKIISYYGLFLSAGQLDAAKLN